MDLDSISGLIIRHQQYYPNILSEWPLLLKQLKRYKEDALTSLIEYLVVS